jgi:inositol-phosphate phosphatase / L-galactose 1-phosphate phosphatase / histidinol-phosphatase
MHDLSQFSAFAAHLADLARPFAQHYFRSKLTITTKPDATPVTLADLEIETRITQEIARVYPTHGILGEEHESVNTEADWVWVIDPIDGTKAFTCGKPQFGTLVALCHRGEPVIGVIDQAITDERWMGVKGAGATFNGHRAQVNVTRKPLSETIILMTTPDMFDRAEHAPVLARLKAASKGIYYGGDCYNYALVASGHVDLVVEMQLKTVDFAAVVNPIIEAGGVACDWAGRALTMASDGTIVAAANQGLADEVLRVLQR